VRVYLGIDLGGTNVKGAAVSVGPDGSEILETTSAPTRANEGPDAVAEVMAAVGAELVDRVGPAEGVGIGVPGLFDFSTGAIVFFTNLPGPWEGFPLRARIADALGLPATLINDARAFTLAEATLGAGAGCRTVACLTLGTGIGGGLFINGQLHFGAYGIGGELGHQTIEPTGPLCGCGNPGCLEALARPPAIAERAGFATFEELVAAANEGDPKAVAAIDDATTYLGIGLANIVTMIGPERIVIGGGGAAAGDVFIAEIRDKVRSRVTLVPPEGIEVVAASLGSTAGAVGAALAAVDSPSKDRTFLAGEIPSARMRRGEPTEG
jgi:glucokinase